MLYCTYDQYAAAGGTVPETAFGVLCSRASRMIDAATFGRAESHAAGCESCREALADACTQIIGLLAAASAVGAVPGAYHYLPRKRHHLRCRRRFGLPCHPTERRIQR